MKTGDLKVKWRRRERPYDVWRQPGPAKGALRNTADLTRVNGGRSDCGQGPALNDGYTK